MTISLPFSQEFTWRKLGYLYFTNSTSYREVLEQNPQWKVTELPPVGAQLRISSNQVNTTGTTQGNFLFGSAVDGNQLDYFPFNTEEEYILSLVKYSPSAVKNREAINGFTLDSEVTTVGG
jgi:hypothetical protein